MHRKDRATSARRLTCAHGKFTVVARNRRHRVGGLLDDQESLQTGALCRYCRSSALVLVLPDQLGDYEHRARCVMHQSIRDRTQNEAFDDACTTAADY